MSPDRARPRPASAASASRAGAAGEDWAEGSEAPNHESMVALLLDARSRVSAVAHRTPIARSRTLDRLVGAPALLKCENLQRMGAFKFRGAWNMVSRLPEERRRQGLVAYSSGNHAQAVALVAQLHGVSATIVMPSWAAPTKLAATHEYGAAVVLHGPDESREVVAERLSRERGLVLIPPFDHPDIVAGQGTAAAELFEDGGRIDLLLVPVGGGGLLSGSALAARHLVPGCRVVGVEPVGADDGVRSFRSGELVRIEHPDTIADGARTPSLGRMTFALIRRYVDDLIAVPDADLVRAMRFAWERLKLVVEPTGALGLAALLGGHVKVAGGRVGVILSGGNVDPKAAMELFARPEA